MKTLKTQSGIKGIPLLKDNICWIWFSGENVVVVDPPETKPIQTWLESEALTVVAILQTHHHADHIGGTQGLLKKWPKAEVVAAKADRHRIPFQTLSVKDRDEISLLGRRIKVIDVAGHTNAHVAYYLPKSKKEPCEPVLFCGDTLFGGGCGRIFEGTADEMYLALKRLSALPEETKVYCAHEYTQANLLWAQSLYPDDHLIEKRLELVSLLRSKGSLSLPSTISLEKKTNLFIRAKTKREFETLRIHKDNWNG